MDAIMISMNDVTDEALELFLVDFIIEIMIEQNLLPRPERVLEILPTAKSMARSYVKLDECKLRPSICELVWR